MDKDNHAINALEWIGMELPANPNRLYLSGYDEFGRPMNKDEREEKERKERDWHLADTNSQQYDLYDQTTAFDMERSW